MAGGWGSPLHGCARRTAHIAMRAMRTRYGVVVLRLERARDGAVSRLPLQPRYQDGR